MMSDWHEAIRLLERFENGDHRRPVEAEQLVAQILRACGHSVTETGFAQSDVGVDCFFDTKIEGKLNRIGVEVKATAAPVGVSAIHQAFAMKSSGHFDRSMVISRAGFSLPALRQADTLGAGEIDLLSPRELRNWLAKHMPAREPDEAVQDIVRASMRELAKLVAERPEALASIEWRDLERMLREVFEGIGYETTLTRSGKDGGFDLELKFHSKGGPVVYLVEVKHWSEQKPGLPHLKKLVGVTVSRGATGGILLSTSGFTQPLYSGLACMSAPVRIGDGAKVVALCQTYYRLRTGFWLEATDLGSTLIKDTRAAGSIADVG